MIDSGAELSLINQDVIERRGLPAESLESPLYIILADQSRVLASYYIPSLLLSHGSWFDSLCCVIVLSCCWDLCSSEEIGCFAEIQ